VRDGAHDTATVKSAVHESCQSGQVVFPSSFAQPIARLAPTRRDGHQTAGSILLELDMLLGRSHRAITYLDDTLMHNRPCKLNGKPLTPQQTNTSTASISSASILSISQKNRLARHVIPMITRLQVTT